MGTHVAIRWVDSETLTEENLEEKLGGVCGILVPGGFGDRGIEGMILAAKYAREKNIPYLGLCLGMQIAVIENARNAAHLEGANSREFDERSPYRVIDFMPGQSDEIAKGGTLRLGAYPCDVMPGSLLEKCATNSTTNTARLSPPRGSFSPVSRRTDGSLRSWNGTITRSISACSITPNSNPVPTVRTRSSAALSPRRSSFSSRADKARPYGKNY